MRTLFLFSFFISSISLADGYVFYMMQGSSRAACWKIKNYAAVKPLTKKRELGRACIEDAKQQTFTCAGLGIEPDVYIYYDTQRECERKRANAEADAAGD